MRRRVGGNGTKKGSEKNEGVSKEKKENREEQKEEVRGGVGGNDMKKSNCEEERSK